MGVVDVLSMKNRFLCYDTKSEYLKCMWSAIFFFFKATFYEPFHTVER